MNLFIAEEPLDVDQPDRDLFATAFGDPEQYGLEVGQRLVVEWEPGSDVVGDLTWVNGGVWVLVTEQVAPLLQTRFGGFALGPVEMVQNPRLKRPQRVTQRTKRRVWLPYEGPPLQCLWITRWVDADMERSSLTPLDEPSAQGEILYLIGGRERIEWVGQAPDPVVPTRMRREPGKGVYIAERQLEGDGFFRVRQAPGWVFCTEAVREYAAEQGWTNVDFFEAGETL